MNIIGIIPARMGSSRFPGKPLARICGLSMLEHVYQRSTMAKSLAGIFVATCDEEIKRAVESFGGKVYMTSAAHERASDRVAEAMMQIEENRRQKMDMVVMIQGDEPMVFPEMIDQAVDALRRDPGVMVANLMAALPTPVENDHNEIKVTVDKEGFALYFSRSPIPSSVKADHPVRMYKQVCIIPFRRDFLLKFNQWEQTPLEMAESIDMLRVLENGHRVKMVLSNFETYSVDVPEDLQKVEGLLVGDPVFRIYKK